MRNGAVRLRSTVAATVAAVIVMGMAGCSSTPKDTAEGEITRVVDAGTVTARIDGKDHSVRLVNVETPSAVADPAQPECLQQQSVELTQRLVPTGSTVRLEFATERADASGQTVAAVFVNDTSINEAIAAAGLGVPDPGDGETRFLLGISVAYEQARTARVGLFSAKEACTVPGQVMAATGIDCIRVASAASATASPGSSPSPLPTSSATQSVSQADTATGGSSVVVAAGASSSELRKQAAAAAATLTTAVELHSQASRNSNALIWRALNQAERDVCTSTINDLVQRAKRDHAALLAAVAHAEKREADAARIAEDQRKATEAAEAARVAEEQRKAAEAEAARIADEQQKAAEAAKAAEEQREAAEAEAARVAAEQAQAAADQAAEDERAQESNNSNNGSSSSGGSGNSNNSGNSSGGSNPSGYTGPRCYAPGGKTWTPC